MIHTFTEWFGSAIVLYRISFMITRPQSLKEVGWIGRKLGHHRYMSLLIALCLGVEANIVIRNRVSWICFLLFVVCMIDEILHQKPPRPPRKLKKLAKKFRPFKQPEPIKQPV